MRHVIQRRTLDLVHEEVTVSVKGRTVTVEGPLGSITKDFSHSNAKMQVVDTKTHGKKFVVRKMNKTTKNGAVVRSLCSIVEKMIQGVRTGFRYKMRLVYAHFPINIKIDDNNKAIEVRNFIGQKRLRRVETQGPETTIKLGDLRDEIYIEGIDLAKVSQTAAKIHLSCIPRNKDIRKFLDGIYVWAKGPIGEEKPI